MAYCSGCEKRHDSRDCPYKSVVISSRKAQRINEEWEED